MTHFLTIPGISNYLQTMKLMEDRVHQIIKNQNTEIIYLTQHQDVYTAGTSFKQEELLKPNNIPVIYNTGRGGKLTYHGPGQRVIYPLLNLAAEGRTKDIRLYVEMLELWIINTLKYFGISAYRIPTRVGIWVKYNNKEAKIGAIGVRIKQWITYHGIAVNISTNLDNYSGIIPCGLEGFAVTSMKELKVDIPFAKFDSVLKQEFDKV
ncbi:MAG: lipoyl(octanoyl) transferase LipB [Rickettsiaceae bacterium]|nr:MAG: lipoyl(octanoyl) transferase LipB [Rickettsiaceae bacterium]